jgi:hypothetical protein
LSPKFGDHLPRFSVIADTMINAAQTVRRHIECQSSQASDDVMGIMGYIPPS